MSAWLRVVVGSIVFVVVVVWEIRRIIRSEFPGIRAIEALAATVPLFLLLFASTYFLMSTFGTGNFSQEDLTRDRRSVFHRNGLLHGGVRRYQRHERDRAVGGLGPDDLGPDHPRVRDQRVHECGQRWAGSGSLSPVRTPDLGFTLFA